MAIASRCRSPSLRWSCRACCTERRRRNLLARSAVLILLGTRRALSRISSMSRTRRMIVRRAAGARVLLGRAHGPDHDEDQQEERQSGLEGEQQHGMGFKELAHDRATWRRPWAL